MSGSDDIIKIWNTETGVCIKTLQGHGGTVESLIQLNDQRFLVSGSEDCAIKVWDMVTGLCTKTLSRYGGYVDCLMQLTDDN